jgi:integrase/recombinase XerD
MAKKAPSVNLTKRVQIVKDGKKVWVFCPVVYTSRNQIRPNVVMVGGIEERHEEGVYHLDWRDNGERHRLSVGKDATEAENRRVTQEKEFAARNAGVPVLAQTDDIRISLTSSIAGYLEEVKLTKKPKTYAAYKLTLEYFAESCKKIYVQDVERGDLLKFAAFLRDEKSQSPRSVYNKFENVMSFLKAQALKRNKKGILTPAGVDKNDWPRFVEEEPEIYEKEELDALFAVCDDQERVWFEFFLMTGMREQEVQHVYWSDINLNHATVRVTQKPDRGWAPKAYAEREVPIPDKLVKSLKTWKATRDDKKCNLVFSTSGCNTKLDFLDCLKAVAERAGLSPADCFLHKFRATFCTMHLWAGVDLRTVQHWMGHKDIESTMRYLRPNRGEAVRTKVNHTFAD